MESLFEYLSRSIKIAVKSVFFNFKQYVCFFVALFIIQMFYGLMSVSYANNNDVEYSHVTAEYDYHMVLRDLNPDQANYIFNDSGAVFKNDLIFKIVRYDEPPLPEQLPRALLLHNIKEFTNLASFLTQIFAEERDNF